MDGYEQEVALADQLTALCEPLMLAEEEADTRAQEARVLRAIERVEGRRAALRARPEVRAILRANRAWLAATAPQRRPPSRLPRTGRRRRAVRSAARRTARAPGRSTDGPEPDQALASTSPSRLGVAG